MYIPIPKVYTILFSWDLKNQKVGPKKWPTTHHQNKKKVSALKSEILIKYKRVNQMDPTRETLRLFASQGDKLFYSWKTTVKNRLCTFLRPHKRILTGWTARENRPTFTIFIWKYYTVTRNQVMISEIIPPLFWTFYSYTKGGIIHWEILRHSVFFHKNDFWSFVEVGKKREGGLVGLGGN